MITPTFLTRLSIGLFTLMILFVATSPVVRGQDCVDPDTLPFPRFPKANINIPFSGVVVYSFENIPDGEQKNQILTAIGNWNSALSGTCSGVVFNPSPPGEYNYATLIIKNGPLDPGVAGLTEHQVYSQGESSQVTITLNPDVADPNSGLRFFVPGAAGYDTAFTKIAMHEIGHAIGLNHYRTNHSDPCRTATPQTTDDQLQTSSVMNNGCQQNDNTNNQSTTATNCDLGQVRGIYACNNFSRTASLAGTFPDYVYANGPRQTQSHEMHISNYNATTGDFTIRFVDYTTTTTNINQPPSFSSAGGVPYVVGTNSDPCLNPDGTLNNVINNVTSPPTFGCKITKKITLTFVGTETKTFYTGASGPYIKVYTGRTVPGSGIPYMHFIAYSAHNNIYSYVHN